MTLSSTTVETNVRDVEYVPLYWMGESTGYFDESDIVWLAETIGLCQFPALVCWRMQCMKWESKPHHTTLTNGKAMNFGCVVLGHMKPLSHPPYICFECLGPTHKDNDSLTLCTVYTRRQSHVIVKQDYFLVHILLILIYISMYL